MMLNRRGWIRAVVGAMVAKVAPKPMPLSLNHAHQELSLAMDEFVAWRYIKPAVLASIEADERRLCNLYVTSQIQKCPEFPGGYPNITQNRNVNTTDAPITLLNPQRVTFEWTPEDINGWRPSVQAGELEPRSIDTMPAPRFSVWQRPTCDLLLTTEDGSERIISIEDQIQAIPKLTDRPASIDPDRS